MERGALVPDPFFWPPTECGGQFAAANLQTQSSVGREHNARWDALGVTPAASDLTTNVFTFASQHSAGATSSILTHKVRRAKRWNNGKSGTGYNAGLLSVDALPV